MALNRMKSLAISLFKAAALLAMTPVLLAACSPSNSTPPEALQPVLQRIGLYSPPSRFEPTRAQIAATGLTGPLLRVVVREPIEQSAGYLSQGSANGVDFFTATDGSNVLLADGILRGTVRFLGDLETAETAQTAQAIASGGAKYFRVVRHRRGEGKLFETRLNCELVFAGREQIIILERTHLTSRYEEACQAESVDPAGRFVNFTNVYWVENTLVRASEQWVSPSTGQLRLELVLP
ncbi:MAG: YjbF family lipoprotein [Pseudomonadota bacterium]